MTRNSEILRFIFRRLLGTLPLLVGVGIFTFVLVRVLPGDPAAYYAIGPMATQEEIAQVRAVLGLDRPVAEQQTVGLDGQLLADRDRRDTKRKRQFDLVACPEQHRDR